METIKHHGENPDKLNTILVAAQKRFGLYGLTKTTMREIASDLNMSKGSLYYYFPDKEHLYKAVVEKEQNELIQEMQVKLGKMNEPDTMLREYVNIRLLFFRKLLNLSRFRFEDMMNLKPLMGNVWKSFREREAKFIAGIFSEGVEKNIYGIENPDEAAELFLDLLKGLRDMVVRRKEFFYLEQDEYNQLIKKTKTFTEIFIKGIKK
ncbi:MAG: TetR/AcrR family transcriptional regulator [Bacteroidota bacterium]|nr:TetR/AcrR family transcriptional regulator [Bacteroidota bacterium]MDP4274680.1 TetR/AcrR family transcriptional regulator [Bacteroidota bacterium]